MPFRLALAALSLALLVGVAHGAGRVTAAVRRTGSIAIDGRLDDDGWAAAQVADDFWQRAPNEGRPPRHPTEFRVAYDDHALYVGVRAHDDEPTAIRRLLHRRDQDSSADWIGVMVDSYGDRRTAFGFALNAAGVQRDLLLYNDTNEDAGWDAVWAGAVHVDRQGWSAEFRIPLGQLRFAEDDRPWGLQVMRFVGRTGETDLWAPAPRTEPAFVSQFGELRGLRGLKGGRRIEVLPYVTAGLARMPHDAADPFRAAADPRYGAGLDAKVGLSSAVTAALTINPDFGQIEADPSQVNLTANESYFAERRPFFLEGSEIFQFGIGTGDGPGGGDTLFYSRRIGAAPHGGVDGDFVDQPTGTTIYGAAKVSGKTASGWSFGLLDALTAEETATGAFTDGTRTTAVVEPLTNYGLVRLKKDLRGGKTALGLAATSVVRRLDGTGLEDALHDRALTGGLELSHKFADDDWVLRVRASGSQVHGSPAAIAETQQSFRHLYQRPDADHLAVDPTRTSLTGGALVWDLMQVGGEHWRYGLGGDVRTAGFEANDLGYHGPVDSHVTWGYAAYLDNDVGGDVQSWRVNVNGWLFGNLAPETHGFGGNVNGSVQFDNFWNVFGGLEYNHNLLDPGGTRGGPALALDPSASGWVGFSSDYREPVNLSASANWGRIWAADDFRGSAEIGLNIQARSNIELFVGPTYFTATSHAQYVDEVEGRDGAPRYLFARIQQDTLGLTVRGAWTFTPALSLQLYAQPFVATGGYRDFGRADATRAAAFADRFARFAADRLTRADDTYLVDEDGDGATDYSFAVPDFAFRELRANLVVRWEYRPGATAFAIWSHGQSDAVTEGSFDLGRDLAGLATAPAEDVVMVKVNYWMGL